MHVETSVKELITRAVSRDLFHVEDQGEVTRKWVLPAMDEIIALAKSARDVVDAAFRKKAPSSIVSSPSLESGRMDIQSYPIGFCQPICNEVYARLEKSQCIQELVARGVIFKKVYIILYGKYFQNAIQLGNLYLDVANDTVDPSKPFYEWKPIYELDYENLESWERVAQVVELYHDCRAVPNRYFPLLSPFIPLITIRSNGMMDLPIFQDFFFLKDLRGGLSSYKEWMTSDRGIAARRLSDKDQKTLAREFGDNDFDAFPFEYSVASNEELVQQAEEIYRMSLRKEGAQILQKFGELAHLAAKNFRSKKLKSVD